MQFRCVHRAIIHYALYTLILSLNSSMFSDHNSIVIDHVCTWILQFGSCCVNVNIQIIPTIFSVGLSCRSLYLVLGH